MVKAGAHRTLSAVLDDRDVMEGFSRLSVAMVLTNPRAPDNPIVYVNDAFERTTGYSRSAVVGRNCRFLQGERTRKDDVDRLRTAIEAGRDVSIDILNYRSSGEPFTNRLVIAPIVDEEGLPRYFLGMQKEVRDGEAVQSDIADSHLDVIRDRVQEDLGVLVASIGNPRLHQSLDDPMTEIEALPRRLECLQLVYEELKLTEDSYVQSGLDLGSLVSRISNAVAHMDGRPGVRFVQIVDPIEMPLDTATRVGLILSEALSNAFRHAFCGLDRGCVELRVAQLAAGGLRMTISDDGVGIPAKISWPSPETTGGALIRALLDGLDATINVARGAAGTVVMIDVPLDPSQMTLKGA